MQTTPRHAWIIGASQGMGLELARELSRDHWQVTISGRNPDTLATAAQACTAKPVAFDATDRLAMDRAAESVFASEPPSLVVMNVGDYRPMPLAEFDAELFVALNRTNYLASVYLLDAVIPRMREAGGGQVLLNASAAGYRGLPNAAPYSAPKAAVIHLAEALAPELARISVRLRVINPGFVRSRLTRKNPFPMPFLLEPEQAARRIADGIRSNSFEITFPRRLTWTLKLLRCLPYRLYFSIVDRWVLG